MPLESPSAGFLSPFLESDLATLCCVHSTSAQEINQLWDELKRTGAYRRRHRRRVSPLTGVRGGTAAAAVSGPSPASDDRAPTSRAMNPLIAVAWLVSKFDCPRSLGART